MTSPAPPQWRASSRCGANWHCVELARITRQHIGVRDSKDVRAILSFDGSAWSTFVGGVKLGSYDLV